MLTAYCFLPFSLYNEFVPFFTIVRLIIATLSDFVKVVINLYLKTTTDLQTELISSPDLERFLSENQDNFYNMTFADSLMALFEQKGLSKSTLAKKAGISSVYLYQIFAGERNPSRNRILCLCFGLSATIEETQELLKHSGYAQLYAKNKRDAIIIFGITHGLTLDEVDDRLFAEGEETLG